MNILYKIEISMSPNYNDNQNMPYCWILLSSIGKEWCNECFGWANSPQEAWLEAYKFYSSFKANK